MTVLGKNFFATPHPKDSHSRHPKAITYGYMGMPTWADSWFGRRVPDLASQETGDVRPYAWSCPMFGRRSTRPNHYLKIKNNLVDVAVMMIAVWPSFAFFPAMRWQPPPRPHGAGYDSWRIRARRGIPSPAPWILRRRLHLSTGLRDNACPRPCGRLLPMNYVPRVFFPVLVRALVS